MLFGVAMRIHKKKGKKRHMFQIGIHVLIMTTFLDSIANIITSEEGGTYIKHKTLHFDIK